MFNLEALINSFGLDYFKDSTKYRAQREKFNLYEMIVAIYGEVHLAKEPNYKNTQLSKNINLVDSNGNTINITFNQDPFENDKTIVLNYTDPNHKNNNHHISINSERGILLSDNTNLIITKDNKLEYYSEESITAYKSLTATKDLNAESDFNNYYIYPDATCTFLDDDANNNWEKKVGLFIKTNLENKNKVPKFQMEQLIDTITNDLFDKYAHKANICSFGLANYCKTLYKYIIIKDNFVKASYVRNEFEDRIEQGIDLIGRNTSDDYDVIHINSEYPIVTESSDENTTDIVIELKNSKIYTTITVGENSCHFVSKLIQNSTEGVLMDEDDCSVIAGDLTGARFYNEKTIADYTKIKEVAFKVEIDGDADFKDFFIEADDSVEFDPSLPLDIQLASFTKEHFLKSKTKKQSEQQLIKSNN